MSHFEIRTCSFSLLYEGGCCVCREPATVAVLTRDLTEHARCERHAVGDHIEARKPLVWAEEWAPKEAG